MKNYFNRNIAMQKITSTEDLNYLCNVLKTIHELNQKQAPGQKHYRLGFFQGKPVLDLNSQTASFHNVVSCMKAIQVKKGDSEDVKVIKSTAIAYLNEFKEKFKKTPPKECWITTCFLKLFRQDRKSLVTTVNQLSKGAPLTEIEVSSMNFLDLFCERLSTLNDASHPHYKININNKHVTLVLKKDKTSTFAEVNQFFANQKQISKPVIDAFSGLVEDLRKHSQKLERYWIFNCIHLYFVNRQLNKAETLLSKMKRPLPPQQGPQASGGNPQTPGKGTNPTQEPPISTETRVNALLKEKIVEVQEEEKNARIQRTTPSGKEQSQPQDTRASTTDPKVKQLFKEKLAEVKREQEEENARRLDFLENS